MIIYPQINTNNKKQVKIQQLQFFIETIGNNAKVKVTETIKNNSDEDCNVTVTLNLDDESAVVGYSFTNQNGEFISQLKEKEQAKREQREATVNGYSSGLIEQNEDNSLSVSLGIVLKGTEVSFTIEYLTRIDVDDDKLVFSIPVHLDSSKQKDIPISVKMIGTSMFEWEGKLDEEKEFEVDIKTEDILIMRDEDTDEVALSSTFINKEKENGEVKVIFVCDRSGSMDGEGITNLKEMLQLFLRQLPVNSKFDIVSFGSRFDFMINGMKQYNENILKRASEKVKKFEADYGGTQMSNPLQHMIDNHIENCHIILLTDGEDFHKDQVIRCVKELSKKNVIHGVGLGSDCDMSLMKTCSQIGRGINVHAKDPNTLGKEVSKITQRILIPSLFNCQINWNVEGEMYPKEVSIFGGVMTCYLKVNDEEQNKFKEDQSIECELIGNVKSEGKKKEMKNQMEYKKEKEINNILLHQLIALQEIRKLEGEGNKEEAKKLSLKYNVLCKETAFIAIDKTTRKEVDTIKTVELHQEIERDTLLSTMVGSPFIQNRRVMMNRVGHCSAAYGSNGMRTMNRRTAPMRSCMVQPKMCMANIPDESERCLPKESDRRRKEEEERRRRRVEEERRGRRVEEERRGRRVEEERKCHLERRRMVEQERKCCSERKQTFASKRECCSERKENERKQTFASKRECFNLIVQSQQATGQFINIQSFIDELQSFDYQGIDKTIIQTFFIICLLQEKFKEFKTEWKLLVKKANQWLQQQNITISDEMKQNVMKVIQSLSF